MRSGNSPRLVAIAGSAVLTIVESSVCMKKPVATSHSITVSERAEGAGEALTAEAGGVGVDMKGGWARWGGARTRYSREKGGAAQSRGSGIGRQCCRRMKKCLRSRIVAEGHMNPDPRSRFHVRPEVAARHHRHAERR